MLDQTAVRVARLRGRLAAESPGARGLERLARNPSCERLRALTLAGITPATAAAEVYGDAAPEGQSPFALGAGNRFEQQIFDDGAARLLALYREAGRLSPDEGTVVQLDQLAPGKTPAVMARRRALTLDFFRQKLAGDPAAPHLIVKGRLAVPLLGVENAVEPDVLVASAADAFYRPVEVKSYPDRAGKTAAADIRGACRQAAVAVVGLREAARVLGAQDPEALVPPVGDLVMRRPGSFFPTLRPMTLRGEVFSLERALAETVGALPELEARLAALGGVGESAALDDPAVLDALPCNYLESCREHCALARRCKEAAAAAGDPVLLGTAARETLAAAGSLERTLELLHARGAPPRSAEERALAGRLREARAAYGAALGTEDFAEAADGAGSAVTAVSAVSAVSAEEVA